MNLKLALSLSLALAAAGCTGKADVRLDLDNRTAANALAGGQDRTLKVKLVAAWLVEDVDPETGAPVGPAELAWLNPECDEDAGGCAPGGEVRREGEGPRVRHFLDLAASSEALGATLNGQSRPLEPGTYRHVRLELCKGAAPAEPNVRWSGPGMEAERATVEPDCAVTSLPFDPPLEVASGEAVVVTLAYDLADAIQAGAPGGDHRSLAGVEHGFRECEDVGDGARACMALPALAPSARRR